VDALRAVSLVRRVPLSFLLLHVVSLCTGTNELWWWWKRPQE